MTPLLGLWHGIPDDWKWWYGGREWFWKPQGRRHFVQSTTANSPPFFVPVHAPASICDPLMAFLDIFYCFLMHFQKHFYFFLSLSSNLSLLLCPNLHCFSSCGTDLYILISSSWGPLSHLTFCSGCLTALASSQLPFPTHSPTLFLSRSAEDQPRDSGKLNRLAALL